MRNLICLLLSTFLFIAPLTAQVENIPLITVTGEASEKIVPDYAVITVKLEKSIGENELNSILENTVFRSEDIAIKFIEKDKIEIAKSHPQFDALKIKSGIKFIQAYIVTVSDLSKLSQVILELSTRNIGSIHHIQYRSSQMDYYKQKVVAHAIENAKAAAKQYAISIDQQIGKAHSIVENNTHTANWYLPQVGNSQEYQSATFLNEAGYITLSSFVTVSFDLLK